MANMISAWRRKRAARRAGKEYRRRANNGGFDEGEGEDENGGMEIVVPSQFRCPISLDIMKDPVTLETGITYDRENIEKWIESGSLTCPITNQELTSLEPIPNHALRKMVQGWCEDNKSSGIERIPTPRIPLSSHEVAGILERVARASRRGDKDGCRELVSKVRNLIKESERNRRCFSENNTSRALSSAFEEFSKGNNTNLEENVAVLEEILSTLVLMFPLDDEEANSYLGSRTSLDCLVWFLKGPNRDLGPKRNAVLVLKEVISSDQGKVNALLEIEGSMESLFKLVKEPICPTATKSSLWVIYQMVAPSTPQVDVVEKFGEMGLVSLLVEMLPGAERSLCEKVLAVLDGIVSCECGRERAYSHALTVPVVLKKVHRVSDLATEFAVSILWKLCKGEKREDGGVLVEALQLSAFQKLLLLLQVGCGERTKEKATELLKLLNVHRELECIESSDFRDLKRTF